jgi:hypothetical protein
MGKRSPMTVQKREREQALREKRERKQAKKLAAAEGRNAPAVEPTESDPTAENSDHSAEASEIQQSEP